MVCDDLLCSWCHHQWQKLFTSEDEHGRLLQGPGTRFVSPRPRSARAGEEGAA